MAFLLRFPLLVDGLCFPSVFDIYGHPHMLIIIMIIIRIGKSFYYNMFLNMRRRSQRSFLSITEKEPSAHPSFSSLFFLFFLGSNFRFYFLSLFPHFSGHMSEQKRTMRQILCFEISLLISSLLEYLQDQFSYILVLIRVCFYFLN